MDKNILKEIIIEQKESLEKVKNEIERRKLKDVEKISRLPHAVIIAGIRRAGKSVLLSQIMEIFREKGYYFNFEDERLINFSVSDFNELYEVFIELYGERKLFFFDEIQNIEGWERFVRRMQKLGNKFFITGSNASLLSKELGTKLTGRNIELILHPFSFQEYIEFNHIEIVKNDFHRTKKRALFKKAFAEYLQEGGMPEYLQYKRKEVLKKVYNDILYRDIIVRYKIKDSKTFRELAFYLISNIANLFSYNKLKKLFQLGSSNTPKSYIDYLENSFLFATTNLYSSSLKQQLVSPKKIYCVDNGLANNIAFKFSDNRGAYLENLVFLELQRRVSEIYYYKTKKGQEVDFLVKNGKRKSLIQVSWELSNEKTREREMTTIIEGLSELHLREGLILTNDEEEDLSVNGKNIKVLPVWKWLLGNQIK